MIRKFLDLGLQPLANKYLTKKDLVKKKQIEWHWVKGHSNNTMNDLADKLAKQATPK